MQLDNFPVTGADLKALLGEALFAETVRHFVARNRAETHNVEREVIECLRYLYLISKYPDRLGGLFLPVEQRIDEIWHYLLLQTREYRGLRERLPGGFFIHHRSVGYDDYRRQGPNRKQLIAEALRWLPLYREEFGAFDEGALPHWTMVRFLHREMGFSLLDIAALDA